MSIYAKLPVICVKDEGGEVRYLVGGVFRNWERIGVYLCFFIGQVACRLSVCGDTVSLPLLFALHNLNRPEDLRLLGQQKSRESRIGAGASKLERKYYA